MNVSELSEQEASPSSFCINLDQYIVDMAAVSLLVFCKWTGTTVQGALCHGYIPNGRYPRFISNGFISNGFISFGQNFKAS